MSYRKLVNTLSRCDAGSVKRRAAIDELKRRYKKLNDVVPVTTTPKQFNYLRGWAIGMACKEDES